MEISNIIHIGYTFKGNCEQMLDDDNINLEHLTFLQRSSSLWLVSASNTNSSHSSYLADLSADSMPLLTDSESEISFF